MPETITLEISATTPIDLFANLTDGEVYLAELDLTSEHAVVVYETATSSVPNPRTVESEKATGSIHPGPHGGRTLRPATGRFLWCWARPNRSAKLAIFSQ